MGASPSHPIQCLAGGGGYLASSGRLLRQLQSFGRFSYVASRPLVGQFGPCEPGSFRAFMASVVRDAIACLVRHSLNTESLA